MSSGHVSLSVTPASFNRLGQPILWVNQNLLIKVSSTLIWHKKQNRYLFSQTN